MAKVIIVGGGVAGLSAGIFSQLSGFETEILESHTKAGGNLTGWDREGYHIDNCIHWLTGTNPVTDLCKMWETLGALKEVEVYQPKTLYTYSAEGHTLSLSRDIETLRRDMLSFSKDDEREIERFIGAVKAAMTLSGISPDDTCKKATQKELIRWTPRLIRYYPMSAGELSRRFHSRVIRGFLASLLGEEFGAVALLFVFSTFCSLNGGIPSGASCAMAERMVQRFESLGGVLRCSSMVKEIETENGRAKSVLLQNGRRVPADYVILACEPAAAFGRLLSVRLMPKRLLARYRDESLRRFSSFHCAFSCDREHLPFEGDLIVDLPRDLQEEFDSAYLILREFSHEESFSPKGKSLLQTICFCPAQVSRRFIGLRGNKEAYRAYKNRLSDRIREVICEQFPILSGTLSCIDCWTPATYSRYTHSPTGSYMSFAFPKARLPRYISGRVKGVENLFLATQWQQAPGGLPSAAFAGQMAARELLRQAKRVRVLRPMWERDSSKTPAIEN